MSELSLQAHPDCRLVTFRIFYHLPDFPSLLNEFIKQELDLVPELPRIHGFLRFWEREVDGPIKTVDVMYPGIKIPRIIRVAGSLHSLN
ncbi:MAG: Usg family protein [Candidatus Paceibacterota bacterium]